MPMWRNRKTQGTLTNTLKISEIEEYKNKLLMAGFRQKSEVRFDRGINSTNYIIIEKAFLSYKLAFHKKK